MIQQTDKIHCRSEKDDCPSGKSAFILILILIVIGLYGCSLKMKDDFLSGIGVCTSFNNAQWLEPMGYSYIEESVSNFLVPLESEATFKKILRRDRETLEQKADAMEAACRYVNKSLPKFKFKNGKWCCSIIFSKCKSYRRRKSEKSKGLSCKCKSEK